MAEPLAVTLTVPDGQEATGIYEDDAGIEAYYVDDPYLVVDGLQVPLPVFDAGGPVFQDSMGNAQRALAVTGLVPPVTTFHILMENGTDKIMTEGGDLILLEAG